MHVKASVFKLSLLILISTILVPALCQDLQHCQNDSECVASTLGPACTVYVRTVNLCGCRADSDCATNTAGHKCVQSIQGHTYKRCACTTDSNCNSGQLCKLEGNSFNTRFCVDKAVCSPKCGFDKRCEDGQCMSRATKKKGDPCYASPECIGSLICHQGVCTGDDKGKCVNDSDCFGSYRYCCLSGASEGSCKPGASSCQ
ncbi:MAG: hypothetical protein J3R72DRAFT_446162 [Linnemannia gamsii]|nr:MAG: hypothetical protein J3R72DRAFT_446162 [Linnemannia gamsii]